MALLRSTLVGWKRCVSCRGLFRCKESNLLICCLQQIYSSSHSTPLRDRIIDTSTFTRQPKLKFFVGLGWQRLAQLSPAPDPQHARMRPRARGVRLKRYLANSSLRIAGQLDHVERYNVGDTACWLAMIHVLSTARILAQLPTLLDKWTDETLDDPSALLRRLIQELGAADSKHRIILSFNVSVRPPYHGGISTANIHSHFNNPSYGWHLGFCRAACRVRTTGGSRIFPAYSGRPT